MGNGGGGPNSNRGRRVTTARQRSQAARSPQRAGERLSAFARRTNTGARSMATRRQNAGLDRAGRRRAR